jgi:hypothetical protein
MSAWVVDIWEFLFFLRFFQLYSILRRVQQAKMTPAQRGGRELSSSPKAGPSGHARPSGVGVGRKRPRQSLEQMFERQDDEEKTRLGRGYRNMQGQADGECSSACPETLQRWGESDNCGGNGGQEARAAEFSRALNDTRPKTQR